MREGWTKQKLGDVITLEYGKPLPKDERCGEKEGFPAFGANGIKCYAKEPYWQHPSIIVGRKGTAGAVNLVEGGFWPLDVTYYVTFDNQKHDRKFLYYMLSALNLPALATGVKPGINRNVVYAIEQYFPPLPEQKRIVAILDEAFAGIETAIANTEKNLANARELFEGYLNRIFINRGAGWTNFKLDDVCNVERGSSPRPIKSYVTDKPEGVNWVKIGDTKGITKYIKSTKQKITPDGALKSRRVNPGDFILTNSMSFGKPYIMATSGYIHDGWFVLRLKDNVATDFFYYLLSSRLVQDQFKSLAAGSVVKNISSNLVKRAVLPLPPKQEQLEIVEHIEQIVLQAQELEAIYQKKLTSLAELKQSLLQKAFSGELTADNVVPITSAKKSSTTLATDSPAFAAHIMAVAYHWHESKGKNKTFGRVKAQKTLHLVEALAQIDLGRVPVKDAAGPNDFAHMRTAETWARENDFYQFVQRVEGQRGYDFVKGKRYNEWLSQALDALEPYKSPLDRVVGLLMPLDTQKAELVATAYAAWNNLLLDGHKPSEADIVHEARDNWHRDKQQYTKSQFREAIARLRDHGMVPTGTGKRVTGQESLEL